MTNTTHLDNQQVHPDHPQPVKNNSTIVLADGIELSVWLSYSGPDAQTVSSNTVNAGEQGRLLVILMADAVASTSHVVANRKVARKLISERKRIFERIAGAHGGRLVDKHADSVLIIFDGATKGLMCAVEAQAEIRELNKTSASEKQMLFRCALISDEVDFDPYDENAVQQAFHESDRLKDVAEPGGIVVSRMIREYVFGRANFDFEFIGEIVPRGFDKSVEIFKVVLW